MAHASAYRDPLASTVARVGQLEREKAELLALTAGVRRARFRTRAGVAAAFALMLVTGPTLAWIVRGRMPPPPAAARTYEGRYELHPWTTLGSEKIVSGPMTLSVDPATGKAHGWATGPIGSVRFSGQVRDRNVDVLAVSPDGLGGGAGEAVLVGDAISGSFGVPKMAASAGFVVEAKREGP
jgi:hypothetical protein